MARKPIDIAGTSGGQRSQRTSRTRSADTNWKAQNAGVTRQVAAAMPTVRAETGGDLLGGG